jgi:hypothetical protein
MMTVPNSLEIMSGVATLCLRDTPRPDDIRNERIRCSGLPQSVSVLRIDLHGVRAMGDEAHKELVALVRDWRRRRGGQVIVAAGMSELTPPVEHGRPRTTESRALFAECAVASTDRPT